MYDLPDITCHVFSPWAYYFLLTYYYCNILPLLGPLVFTNESQFYEFFLRWSDTSVSLDINIIFTYIMNLYVAKPYQLYAIIIPTMYYILL